MHLCQNIMDCMFNNYSLLIYALPALLTFSLQCSSIVYNASEIVAKKNYTKQTSAELTN